MNRLARRKRSSVTGGVSGRLITDRQTRETKKVTNAAAVNGTPSCQPNAITPAAPIANSVSQKTRSPPSAIRNRLLSGRRPRRRAFEKSPEELLQPVEHVEVARVQQRLVRVVREHDHFVVDVVRAQQ